MSFISQCKARQKSFVKIRQAQARQQRIKEMELKRLKAALKAIKARTNENRDFAAAADCAYIAHEALK